jgi:transposase
MMGRQTGDQSQLFYAFNLEERIPDRHLLRRINPIVAGVLGPVREKLKPFYSEIGRPSIDPELMLRMLIVGYCYAVRFERKLCEEVELHLAYRWFCRLDLEDKVPDHSTFSVNRHGRFRDSDVFRQLFEAVVAREVLNGIFYVLSTGCQWNAVPTDLPPKSTLYDYLDLWDWDGTLERIHQALYLAVREQAGREASPTVAIIDAQSAKGAQKGGRRSIRRGMTRARSVDRARDEGYAAREASRRPVSLSDPT